MRERRTALVVLRIQNALSRRPNCLIYSEALLKPSNQGALGAVKKRLIKV